MCSPSDVIVLSKYPDKYNQQTAHLRTAVVIDDMLDIVRNDFVPSQMSKGFGPTFIALK